jgi:hypothetical protein
LLDALIVGARGQGCRAPRCSPKLQAVIAAGWAMNAISSRVDLGGVGDAHHVRSTFDLDVTGIGQRGVQATTGRRLALQRPSQRARQRLPDGLAQQVMTKAEPIPGLDQEINPHRLVDGDDDRRWTTLQHRRQLPG